MVSNRRTYCTTIKKFSNMQSKMNPDFMNNGAIIKENNLLDILNKRIKQNRFIANVEEREFEDYETGKIALDSECRCSLHGNHQITSHKQLYEDYAAKVESVKEPIKVQNNSTFCRSNNKEETIIEANKLHQCNECKKNYTTRQDLFAHIKVTHDLDNKIKCQFCNQIYCTASNLKRHLDYFCVENRKRKLENNLSEAVYRNNNKEDNKLNQCSQCKKNYTTIQDLLAHVKAAHDLENKCQFCNRIYCKRSNLKRHQEHYCLENSNRMSRQKYQENSNIEYDLSEAAYTNNNWEETTIQANKFDQSNECENNYTTRQHLIAHMNAAHNSELICRFCKRTFCKPLNLKRHQDYFCSQNNNKKEQPKIQENIHQCDKCDEIYETRQLLVDHIKAAHAFRVICQFCKKTYSCHINLKRHQDLCSKNESVQKSNEILEHGMFSHAFICDYCKKSYTHKNTLISHMKSHFSGSKKYQCNLCDKNYTKKHNLKIHMQRIHLNEKK